MPASGTMTYDNQTYTFKKETDFGTLDWGRDVWTYDNRWYWDSGNTVIDGKVIQIKDVMCFAEDVHNRY